MIDIKSYLAGKQDRTYTPDYDFNSYLMGKARNQDAELAGVPPLTFVSDGSNLVDWSILGASGGVGEQTKNLVDLGNYDSTNYGLRGYVQDGMLRIVGKYNSDAAHMPFRFDVTLASGSYILSGALIEVNNIYINLLRYTTRPLYEIVGNDKGSGFPFVVNAAGDYCVAIYIARAAYNKDIDATIPIMLRPADTSSDFEPYGYKIPVTCGGVTTTIYTQSRLMDGDVLTLADTGVDIPTVNGSNTLTVGTTVQPSSMTITYKKG